MTRFAPVPGEVEKEKVEEENACYGMPSCEAPTFYSQQEGFVLHHSMVQLLKNSSKTLGLPFCHHGLENQTEFAHLGHHRISVKSHPMLKKVSAIIQAF